MKLTHTFLTLASLVSGFAFGASNPTLYHFTYSIRVPAGSGSCADAANDLAAKIVVAAEVSNVKGSCLTRTSFTDNGEQFTMDMLQVDYDAANPLNLNTAAFPNYDFSAYGLYPKFRDCLNDMPAQVDLYTRATGLSPLVTTCVPSHDALGGFDLRIDGVGVAQRVLQTYHNSASPTLEENKEWTGDVLNFITSMGGMPAKVGHEMVAYYGTPRTMGVSSVHVLTTKTEAECSAQVDEAVATLRKFNGSHIFTKCNTDVLGHYTLDILFDGSSSMYFTSTSESTFLSYEECMAVRKAQLTTNPAAPGWVGSFCSLSDFDPQYYVLLTVTQM